MSTERLQSMTDLLGELVSHPSRAGVDDCAPVLDAISGWLRRHGIPHEWVRDPAGRPLGLAGGIEGGRPGPAYLLDATADTAPFGDPGAWRHPPDRPTIEAGWLYGRGSADSKAGIAVFCHVLAELLPGRRRLAGGVNFVFDVEEHTGTFAGIRAYMAKRLERRPAGVMIGYPGNDRLVVGARGFLRAQLVVRGIGAHSGSSSRRGINAIDRARVLLDRLAAAPLPPPDGAFPLPPRITATGIRGGGSYSLVPDRCELELDIRLTPAFNDGAARALLQSAVARLDGDGAPATGIRWQPGWPAYRLEDGSPLAAALSEAARDAFGRTVPQGVAGPSCIANYLHTLGIPATAGLGVTYRNVHAADECVLLETLEPAFLSYRQALLRLLR
ncbi:MAG: M20/M25/M40 family metallo-hydrolase [Gammaproteobacteria bacterium]|nr:M20/M25/M40 family metallo-hydrolase [Gammaproteobacteria bacterium]